MNGPLASEAYVAICQVLYRYCLHFDRNEPERIPELFTRDAVIDYGPEFPAIRGRDSIESNIATGLRDRFSATSHHVTNVMVEADDEVNVRVVAYVYAWHAYVDGSPDGELWGQYHCRMRLEEGAWLISDMQLRASGTRHFHRSAMHPIGRRPVA